MTDAADTPSSEIPTGGEAGLVQSGAPAIQVLTQYIRDLSFENPHAPQSVMGGEAPGIEVNVELSARGRDDNLFEVEMTLTVSAKRTEQVAFHIQLVYGGLFAIQGVAPEAMEPVLLVECPRFLFPFARQIIANVTSEGGFPAFRMEPLDFAQIYLSGRNQLQGQPPAGNA